MVNTRGSHSSCTASIVIVKADFLVLPIPFTQAHRDMRGRMVTVSESGKAWTMKYDCIGLGLAGLVNGWIRVVQEYPLHVDHIVAFDLENYNIFRITSVTGTEGIIKKEHGMFGSLEHFPMHVKVESGESSKKERVRSVVDSLSTVGTPTFNFTASSSTINKGQLFVPKSIQEFLPNSNSYVRLHVVETGEIHTIEYVKKGLLRIRKSDFKNVLSSLKIKVGTKLSFALEKVGRSREIYMGITRVVDDEDVGSAHTSANLHRED